MKLRNRKYLTLILTVIIMVAVLTPSVGAGEGKIEDMNFKGADIRDVLRIIADVAETNLVIDGSVKGNITIHLSNITFNKALDMITTSHQLEYKWDDNIIVVAPPERMQDIYGMIVTEVIRVNDPALDQVKKITNEIYPELNIQINQRKNQLIIQGKEDMVNKATGLIDEIKYSETDTGEQDGLAKTVKEKTPGIVTEIISVKPANFDMIVNNVQNIYPGLRVAKNKNNYQLILHGQDTLIKRAIDLINEIDLPVQQEEKEAPLITEIVKIRSREPATIINNIKNIYDNLHVSQNNNLVIINGKQDNVKKALDLIEKLDIAVIEEKDVIAEEDMITRVIKVNRENIGSIFENVSSIFGNLKLAQNKNTDQIVLHGEQELVNKALALIEEIDEPLPENEEYESNINSAASDSEVEINDTDTGKDVQEIQYMEVVNLKNSDLNKLKSEISNVKPGLEIKISDIYQQLLIKGNKKDVLAAKSMALEYDKQQKVITRMVRVDYADIENIKNIVANFHPEVKLQLNNSVKEMIIKGKEKDVNDAISLVNELDITRQQVIIEARVEEISSTELSEIGVNPGSLSRIHFIRENSGDSGGSGPITDIELTWPEFLDAMEREGAADTLANPHLMTLNGERAKLLIGQRIPVKMENSSGETSIKYIEAGISLEFEPWITEDGYIELQIQPKVSSLGEEIYSGYPSIKTREVDTRLRLQDGETLAIGGLIQEDISENLAKVPLLSEIPILGELFKDREKETTKTELLIFITPRIVNESPEPVSADNQSQEKGTDLNHNSDDVNTDEKSNNNNEDESSQTTSEINDTVNKTANISQLKLPEIDYTVKDLNREELQQILNESRKTRDYTGEENLPLTLNILYRVKTDETLEDIASIYGVEVETIKFVNYIDKGIKESDLITVPIPRDHLYRLQEGETLWQVSQKLGVEVEKLIEINNIEDVSNLPVGFIVIFPEAIR